MAPFATFRITVPYSTVRAEEPQEAQARRLYPCPPVVRFLLVGQSESTRQRLLARVAERA